MGLTEILSTLRPLFPHARSVELEPDGSLLNVRIHVEQPDEAHSFECFCAAADYLAACGVTNLVWHGEVAGWR